MRSGRPRTARAAAITGPFDAIDYLAPATKGADNGPARATTLLMDARDELDTLRALKIADEFKRPAMILGSGYEFRRLAAIGGRKDIVHIIPLAFPKTPDVSSPGKIESTELRELMTWEQAPTNPRRLAQAGITFALTTAKLRDKGDFRKNLLSAIKHGLTEEQALAALTRTPADIAGVAGTLGTIEAGKRANLIVVDGPIFAEKSKIRSVWADGREHEIGRADNRIEGEWTFAMGGVDATLVIAKDAVSVKLPKPPEAEGAEDEKPEAEKAEPDKPDAATPDAAKPDAEQPEAAEPEAEKAEGDAAAADEKKADKPATVTVKAKKQRVEDNRATFVIDGDDLPKAYRTPHHEGVMTVSVTLIGDTLRGQVQFPAGDRADFTAARKAAEDDAKKKDDDAKAEKKKEDDADHAIASIPETYGYPFGPYALTEQPAQPDYLELRGATLWTNTDAGRIDNATIIIKKGKIDYVGKPFTGKRPEGAIEIDLPAGTHITPGIIDAHSHTGIARGVNEGGQAITSEVRIQDVLDPDDISWYRQLAGGVTAVLQLHGSANAIGGQSQTTKNRWGVENPEDMHMEGAIAGIKFALGENPRGANWSSERGRYPQSRMGVETLIRDRFTAAKEYAAAHGGKPAKGTPTQRRDLELEAIAEILAGERLIHCHSYRQDEIVMLCLVARDFGFKIGTFQHILEGYKVADYVRDYSGGGSAFSDWWAYKVEVQDAIPGGPPLMHDVGAVVSYNSDSDELARRLNVEAAKAVKYGGLSPEEALKFVTLNPAKQLKIDSRTGSLEPGKDADIAVWNGNPLSGMSKCIATYVDGRKLFSTEDDAAHRERITAERQRLVQKVLTEGKKRKAEDEGREPKEPRTPVAEEQPPGDDSVSEEYRRARERLYLDMLNRGMSPDAARPGECGCGILHW